MKLDYKKTFYIGLAFFLITLFWQTYDSVITKILIDKFGLNQTWSGFVMALDNVLALFLIPLFGTLSDKQKSKKGRRTPYIVVGTIVAAFVFMGLSFSDNIQTSRLRTETSVTSDYQLVIDMEDETSGGEIDLAEWTILQTTIETEWTGLLTDGIIDQERFDKFEEEVIDSMDQYLTDNTITQDEENQLKELYYDHLNQRAWIQTSQSPVVFIVFVVNLLVALLAMAIFRSPTVALMPDVTIKPLRSKGNAVINLMGTFGGILAILVLTVFGLDKLSYVSYAPAFITVGVLMLGLLTIFLWKVKEPKLVTEREELDVALGLTEEAEAVEKHESVEALAKEKRKSLILILASVFLWFTGYNAVTTKLSDYAPKVLDLGFAMPLLIAQGAALIAFIPIGILATKIGRRKTVLIGIIMLTVCFGSIYFLTPDTASLMYIIFGLTGIAWATINVNSYPMVVELAKGSDVGKYTGYYYTFSMAAQILTPIISGALMDATDRTILFPYAAFFVFTSFITMLLVKHGDAKVIGKDSVLENFDVDMD
ncbi:MAG: MFS transporter [Tenericutes bacterium]|nr:MFS transporter [Mycoplasmatota bacterium]